MQIVIQHEMDRQMDQLMESLKVDDQVGEEASELFKQGPNTVIQ